MAVIVSDTAGIITAASAFVAALGAAVVAILTVVLKGKVAKIDDKVDGVIHATDGLKTELVAEVRAASLKTGREQGVAQEAAKRDDKDAAHAAGKAEGIEQESQKHQP